MNHLEELYIYSYKRPHTQEVIRNSMSDLDSNNPNAIDMFRGTLPLTLRVNCHMRIIV